MTLSSASGSFRTKYHSVVERRDCFDRASTEDHQVRDQNVCGTFIQNPRDSDRLVVIDVAKCTRLTQLSVRTYKHE